MGLVETVEAVKSGVFHLVCLRGERRVASGTGFFAHGHLITNFHVANIPGDTLIWIRRDGDEDHRTQGMVLRADEWLGRIRRASEEHSYDYAILEMAELKGRSDVHEFSLGQAAPLKIGMPIAFLGFPLEHMNVTCHAGIISAFRKSGVTDFVQIDASVNSSNSGGPLFNPQTGEVVGIVSRKATGLSTIIRELRDAIDANIRQLSASKGGVFISGIDPLEGAIVSQNQLKITLAEIERQANVGIGYAVDVKHILQEDVLQTRQ